VKSARESGSRSSSKGILIGAIAAGVLLLAGVGWWYMRPQSGDVQAGAAPVSSVQASVLSAPAEGSPPQPQGNASLRTNPAVQTNPGSLTNSSAQSNSSSNPLSVVPAGASAATSRNSQPSSNPVNGGTGATSSAAAQPAAEQPKKPILGELHLATPKITARRNTQNGEPDAGIALSNDQPLPSAEGLNAGLVSGNNQPSAPAAPLPIGGDVRQAKLISSAAPVYPTLAKNQHVSGSVLVDALIDATGHVTTMKVVSGPTLLHQAAMDALKQWKYQPAALDGKPVSMHLTVTIQFRLQ
jgi:TonB family protein